MMLQWKGRSPRTDAQQTALACRIMAQRHAQDVYDRAIAELGKRGAQLGPLDLTRNTLSDYVNRLGRAYDWPPAVTGDLPVELSKLVGDYSASTLIEKYALIDARPMPTGVLKASREAMRYRLGAGYAGILLGWSERAQRLYLEVVTPDDLEVVFASDDPTEPTIIRHRRWRDIQQQRVESFDCYDLTSMKNPIFRIEQKAKDDKYTDITETVTDEEVLSGEAYPWRYEDGTPYHRIVITGHPRDCYRTNQLIEATLKVSVLWTHWGAGIRDAGHPQRWMVGLQLDGLSSSTDNAGEVGIETGPETVLSYRHSDPERPGFTGQYGPGFDPKITGEAVRAYELQALSMMGLPVAYEQTGGEPTATEAEALERAVQQTYAECRRTDGEVLRRLAALASTVEDTEGARVLSAPLSEGPYAVLYGDEVEDALEAVLPPEDSTDGAESAGSEEGKNGEGTGGNGKA